MTIEHDREWIKGCIQHDGFIKTNRSDKANQIILEALRQTEWIPCSEQLPSIGQHVLLSTKDWMTEGAYTSYGTWWSFQKEAPIKADKVLAWMELPEPYRGE